MDGLEREAGRWRVARTLGGALVSILSSFVLVASSFVAFPAAAGAASGATFSPPSSIPDNCSLDVSSALQAWLDALPAGSTAEFPANACYLTQETVTIQGTSDLTIEGNGAVLERTEAPPGGWAGVHLAVLDDTGLTVDGLAIQGTYVPGISPTGDEIRYGILVRSSSDVTFDHVTVHDVSGDGLAVYPPSSGTGLALNDNLTFEHSTIDGTGYHGVTLESIDRGTFSNDVFENIAVDAVDIEYDVYGSVIGPDGQVEVAGDLGVAFTGNTFANWGADAFTLSNGNGTVVDNLSITDNTFDGGPIIALAGNTVPVRGVVITGNTATAPPAGGTPIGPYSAPSPVQLSGVDDATVEGNAFPVEHGFPGYFWGVEYGTGVEISSSSDVSVDDNAFLGASEVVRLDGTANESISACANAYGFSTATGSTTSEGACGAGYANPTPIWSAPARMVAGQDESVGWRFSTGPDGPGYEGSEGALSSLEWPSPSISPANSGSVALDAAPPSYVNADLTTYWSGGVMGALTSPAVAVAPRVTWTPNGSAVTFSFVSPSWHLGYVGWGVAWDAPTEACTGAAGQPGTGVTGSLAAAGLPTGPHIAVLSFCYGSGRPPILVESPQFDVVNGVMVFSPAPGSNGQGTVSGRVPAGAVPDGLAIDPATGGAWLLASDGGVSNFDAPWTGSPKAAGEAQPGVVGIAATSAQGYLVLRANGGVLAYGTPWHGSLAGRLPAGVRPVGIAADPATGGYWILASDGGVFNFDAPWTGSPKAAGEAQPGVVGIAALPTRGAYEVLSTGGRALAYG